MIWLRSLAFNLIFYGWSAAICISMLWTIFCPPRFLLGVLRYWSSSLAWIERTVGGIKMRIVGWENVPEGPCIIAAKHQSAWETFKLQYIFGNPVIVLKKELLDIPVWGQYMKSTGMIPIDRGNGGRALTEMMDAAHKAVDANRKIVIFPQGTRIKSGEKRPYKSGVAALYKELNIPVIPMALNSGLLWPKNSFLKKPGTITVEFLPAIPPGLSRDEMMQRLKEAIETTTERLEAKDYN